jgi:hypothetical protein
LGGRLSGELRDQTVDQASELAAEIVFGLTSMIKPSSLRLARKLQTGEEALDRPNPTFSVPPTAPTASATTRPLREDALASGMRVAVHDSRHNDPNPSHRRISLPIPAPPRWRPPAARSSAIGCPGPVTAS